MNNLMNNSARGFAITKSWLFVLVLLITACDGGIFGTGGPGDLANSTMIPIDADPLTTEGSASDTTIDDNMPATETSGESASTTGSTGESDGAAGGDSTNNSSASGGQTGGSETTDGNTTTSGQTEGVGPAVIDNQFTNTVATLNDSAARINLINTSSLAVNVIENGSQTLFGVEGVAPNSQSNVATLQQNNTGLDIVDNNTRAETVVSFSTFDAASATFTTLIVRQNEAQIDAIPLINQTSTTDQTLIKVRVIQATPLSNASVEAVFELQSAGANPGGVDRTVGPLSFDTPLSDYLEIPEGDYELKDPANRIDNQMVSFEGGNVYTIVLVDNGTDVILVVNDTEAAEQ